MNLKAKTYLKNRIDGIVEKKRRELNRNTGTVKELLSTGKVSLRTQKQIHSVIVKAIEKIEKDHISYDLRFKSADFIVLNGYKQPDNSERIKNVEKRALWIMDKIFLGKGEDAERLVQAFEKEVF